MKRFSEVFVGCLPHGTFDPEVRQLRIKREENRLSVELEGTPPPGWAGDAERRIRGMMGLSAADIVFAAPSPADGGLSLTEGEKSLSPSVRKTARSAGRSGALFGKPSRLSVTDMDTLPRERAKACTRGRVFMLGETRERRMRIGNRWNDCVVFEFYLTDGTGSVLTRCVFEKGKEPPGLEKRLKELHKSKGSLKVYGTMEPYTVMEKEEWLLLASCAEEAAAKLRKDTAPEKRVELHLHTQMSEKDAVTPVAEAIARAARWGHPAVAVTDHGVCHAFPDAMAAAAKHGIKVLYGCEGYLDGDKDERRSYFHIILIVRTQEGLHNLYKLVSASHTGHFKRRPIITRELLEQYREGLLVGTACEAGEVFTALKKDLPRDEIKQIADFYDMLEIQPLCNNMFLVREGRAKDEEQLRDWNRAIVELGRELGKPVCATGDVHFLDPEDEVYRDVLMAGKGMLSADPTPLYFKTTDEMLEEFSYLGKDDAYRAVVTVPRKIAELCENVRPVRKGEYFPLMEGSAGELRRTAYERAHALYGDALPPQVGERLEKELGSIIGKGYDIIYTISQKLVRRSMENGYLVGSRGSVGSSVAAYFAGITEVNALPPHYRCPMCRYSEFPDVHKEDEWGGVTAHCGVDLPDKNCPACGARLERDGFDIPFATFLGFDADKKPDIDLNFSSLYHERAGEHLIELFGEDKVFRAGTISTVAEKTALGYTLKYLEEQGLTATDAELRRLANGCEGVKTTTGQHPGGMIIVPQDMEITDFCPIHYAANKKDGKICTHFDYHAIEDNLLKMDLLGHDCPTFIGMLAELTGEDPLSIPLDDPSMMSLFSSSAALGFENDDLIGPVGTVGIPEYGTRFVRGMLQKTKPTTFDELVRIAGLSHGEAVWRGNAEKLIDDGKATLREVICARDDITLYLIDRGIPGKQALLISECVRKKGPKPTPEMEETMRSAGVPGWYIQSCRDIEYLFPKAHSAAYAMMSARIAWFKVHRPEAFYAVYFTLKISDFNYKQCRKGDYTQKMAVRRIENDKNAPKSEQDKANVYETVYEMLRRGIVFDPLDIYTADPLRFAVSGKGRVSVPLMAVSGLGEAAANSIAEARKNGRFLAEDDILARCRPVTKAHIEALRDAGALGGMPETAQINFLEQM